MSQLVSLFEFRSLETLFVRNIACQSNTRSINEPRWFRHEKKSNRVSSRIEILKNRIESKFCGSKFDPESIFKTNKWYYRIPGVATPSERVWSACGYIVSHKRENLSSESVKNLVFLHENMH